MPNANDLRVVNEIKQRHGSIIDLDKSPHVAIDIIRRFGTVLEGDDGGHGAPGSPKEPTPSPPKAPGPSPSPGGGGAPGNPPPPRGPNDRDLGMSTMMNIMLDMKREIAGLHAKLDKQVATPAVAPAAKAR